MADYKLPGQHVFEGMVLTGKQRDESIDKIKEMMPVEGDILVTSYTRSGSTWMEEIIWLMINNADIETASQVKHMNRLYFLEHDDMYRDNRSGIERFEDHVDAKRPLLLKTHTTANIVAKAITSGKLKVILVIRNPKDTLVSLYHFYRMNGALGYFPGTWDSFFELYKKKDIFFGDYFDWYESWLPFLNRENVQVHKYEDMKADIVSVIDRLTEYLGVDLQEGQVQKIIKHTSFESMETNKMVNYEGHVGVNLAISPFIRKGEVGDWKNYFTCEQSQRIDEEYDSKLAKNGLELKFE